MIMAILFIWLFEGQKWWRLACFQNWFLFFKIQVRPYRVVIKKMLWTKEGVLMLTRSKYPILFLTQVLFQSTFMFRQPKPSFMCPIPSFYGWQGNYNFRFVILSLTHYLTHSQTVSSGYHAYVFWQFFCTVDTVVRTVCMAQKSGVFL